MQTSLGIAVTVIVDRDGETASAGVGRLGGGPGASRTGDRTGQDGMRPPLPPLSLNRSSS